MDNIKNVPDSETMDLIHFWATVAQHSGFAKSARYMVQILPTGANNLLASSGAFMRDFTYLCESTEFPGRGFLNADIRYYGTNFKIPYQTTYDDISMTFLCRDKFLERKFFDNWMEIINPVSTYNFTYRENYLAKINMIQLSDMGIPQYKFSFENAWPVLVNPQPVTWADDNFHRLTVSFTYNRWYREEIDTTNLPGYDIVYGSNPNTTQVLTPRFNTEFSGPRTVSKNDNPNGGGGF